MSRLVTLCDGRQVDSASEEWRQECLQRHRHVDTLRRLDLRGRRAYLAELARAAGDEFTRRVGDDYIKDWEARRAARESQA